MCAIFLIKVARLPIRSATMTVERVGISFDSDLLDKFRRDDEG